MVNRYVEKVARVLEIKIIHGSVRHPQSQGKVRHSGIDDRLCIESRGCGFEFH